MASTATNRRQGLNSGAAVKVPCRCATTANITLSGLQTIDGVTVVADDRVLVKDQTTASENGIYLASSSTWQRDKDWDGAFDVVKGTIVHVTDGTTYSRTWWEATTSNPITPGSTSLTLTQGITDSGIITFTQSGSGAVPRKVANKFGEMFSVADFGTAGDGAAFQEALDAMSTGDHLIVPKGVWEHDGTLLVPNIDYITIEFQGGAWLAPSAGWALKFVSDRVRILNPRVRINTGSTMTRGIWVSTARHALINGPVIWAFADIPANFVGIDVDDNAYWTEINGIQMDKNSGSHSGTFAKGVRFLTASNAGKVWGGSIANTDDGVYIHGSNSVRVIGVDFEDCTDGVEMAEAGVGGNNNPGTIVAFCRGEGLTNLLNVSQTTSPQTGLGEFALPQLAYNYTQSGTEITDPNGHGFHQAGQAFNHVDASGNQIALGNLNAKHRIDTGGSSPHVFRLLRSNNAAGGMEVLGLIATGATTGIGYAAGSGGTVTQGDGSGKATAVTLSKVTGEITLDDAELAADTTVSFALTNTAIAATDHVLVSHVSGGTLGAYNFAADPAAQSATIYVRNITAGNLSEAIVIRVTVIKAVNA